MSRSDSHGHQGPGSSRVVASSPAAASGAQFAPVCQRAWDELSDEERREQLDAMDPDDLRAMATSLPAIEQAKGVLMGCFGLDAPAAFALLTRLSSSTGLKLRDVAANVVQAATSEDADGQPPATSPRERVSRLLRDGPAE